MKGSLGLFLVFLTSPVMAMQSKRCDDNTLIEQSAQTTTHYVNHSPSLLTYPLDACSIYRYKNGDFYFLKDLLEEKDIDSLLFAQYWDDIQNKNFVTREKVLLIKLDNDKFRCADLMILGTRDKRTIYKLLGTSLLKYRSLCLSSDLKSFLEYATVKDCIQS